MIKYRKNKRRTIWKKKSRKERRGGGKLSNEIKIEGKMGKEKQKIKKGKKEGQNKIKEEKKITRK